MDEAVPGFLCRAYYNSGTNSVPVWVEMDKIKDLAHPHAPEKIDVSARYSKKKRYAAGQFDSTVSFGYQYFKGSGDTVLAALRERYLAREAVQIAIADGDIATDGTTYHKDWYICTKFDSAEDLGSSKVFDLEYSPTPYFVDGAQVEESYETVQS